MRRKAVSALMGACLSLAAAHPASAQDPVAVADRAASTIAATRQFNTADAVNEEGLVEIGGVPQWMSVRGRHRSNPILLFLHGGPGFTASPVSYWYMRDWEEYFTVVQWDQRGAGKTYAASDPDAIASTLSVERLVEDTEAVIGHLRRTYGQDRIVLMAHSFGTVLGIRVAQRHPEWLYAYVGMGQFVDFQRSERIGYEATLAAARAAGNAEAVTQLTAIAPFPDAAQPERNLQNLGTERFWLATYGGYYRPGGFGHNAAIAALNPAETAQTLAARDAGQALSGAAMWGELGETSLWDAQHFDIPMVMLQGRHDLGTSSALAEQWFAGVQAPAKRLVWFEDSAHMVYEEEPGKLLVTLVTTVLPLTRPVAGTAPAQRP